jgi:hypothetical protein
VAGFELQSGYKKVVSITHCTRPQRVVDAQALMDQ